MDNRIRQQALTLLEARSAHQHLLLTQRIRRGFAQDVAVVGDSVRLWDTQSGKYMFASEDRAEFADLLGSARQRPGIFFLSTDALFEHLSGTYTPVRFEQWYVDTIYPEDPADPGFYFTPALESDLPAIVAAYCSTEFHPECLRGMIRDRPSVCARSVEDGALAGFMLTHEDGETGPMVVFAPYHGHKLGEQLIRRISNDLLSNGVAPIGHIACDNEVSKKLHRRMGYHKCDGHVLWVYPRGAAGRNM